MKGGKKRSGREKEKSWTYLIIPFLKYKFCNVITILHNYHTQVTGNKKKKEFLKTKNKMKQMKWNVCMVDYVTYRENLFQVNLKQSP